MQKISVMLHYSKYSDDPNHLANCINNRDFGFEFEISSPVEKTRRIFSHAELLNLQNQISNALEEYNKALY